MIVGVVDIGTNSMRLLIEDEGTEILREVRVTGLGSGVDAVGHFDAERVRETLTVLQRYGDLMDGHGVQRRRAVATSATRDASDGPAFIDRAEQALGVRPEVISGAEEAALAYLGATDAVGSQEPSVVIDIGGGSTEFVYGEAGTVRYATSIDLGSVRLAERVIPSRPASVSEVYEARAFVAQAFSGVELPGRPPVVLGVAGTFTSLAAIALDLPTYDRDRVNGSVLSIEQIRTMIDRLASMSVAETAAVPSLDPRRAPVLLSGALVAEGALVAVDAEEITVSERDLLDGLVLSMARA
jgi:exopolyphosphatase/guanosine-5'-triphosphate,3'-diphosphate pyrophosphatase